MNSLELQAIYVMWMRQLKRFMRARSRLIANIIQPFFFLAFLGLGLRPIKFPGLTAGMSFLDFLAPGMVALSIIFASMFAGVSIIWDRQFGFLKEILVAPVSRFSIVVGRILGGATISIIQGLIILAVSILLGAEVNLVGLIPGLFMMLLTAFFAVGLGITLASRMEDPHAFSLIMNLIMMPATFLSTAYFPLETMTNWLRTLIYVNPLTYVVDGLRGCLTNSFSIPPWIDLIVTVFLCAATMSIGTYLFNKSEA